ncbi:MAG TPA: DUF4345 domain-containing protein [Aliidongia sp.]|uniref:DUF4345 domain-containing protein n=1 Tax=Aliidongia sp. TaxID=1914230 RepID=UPI002DDD253B|nr:DUF4345 domain-containing protein [Aliidongia sp.]HEV2673445.1 DUF4345 domain-containing protein [Aliidongia sp.]
MPPRRWLQTAVAVGGLVPVGAGLAGILLGPAMVAATASVPLDSHYRYLSGLLLAIGLGFWSCIPGIERRSGRFRLLTGLVFIGGLGRAVSLETVGLPDLSMLFGLVMELAITPALCLWQTLDSRKG